MSQPSKSKKRGCLGKIITWFRYGNFNDQPDFQQNYKAVEREKKELIEKIRDLLVKHYPEKLYLPRFSENELKAISLENLQQLLLNLEKSLTQEPE